MEKKICTRLRLEAASRVSKTKNVLLGTNGKKGERPGRKKSLFDKEETEENLPKRRQREKEGIRKSCG